MELYDQTMSKEGLQTAHTRKPICFLLLCKSYYCTLIARWFALYTQNTVYNDNTEAPKIFFDWSLFGPCDVYTGDPLSESSFSEWLAVLFRPSRLAPLST